MDPVLLVLAATVGSGLTAIIGTALAWASARAMRTANGEDLEATSRLRMTRLRQLDPKALAEFGREAEAVAAAIELRENGPAGSGGR